MHIQRNICGNNETLDSAVAEKEMINHMGLTEIAMQYADDGYSRR